jgi:hypothetical protein
MQSAPFKPTEVVEPTSKEQNKRLGLVEIAPKLLSHVVGGSPKGGWSSQAAAGLDAGTSSPKGGW